MADQLADTLIVERTTGTQTLSLNCPLTLEELWKVCARRMGDHPVILTLSGGTARACYIE